jgi:hypothetical protein
MANTLATTNQRKKVSRARTKAIVLVLLLPAIYSSAGLQSAMMQSPVDGNRWKGLVPLQSTRRDVEALLGPPTVAGQSSYETNEETVFVEYITGPCEKGLRYGYYASKDTVLSIVVSPKQPVMFTDLKIDKNKYLQSKPSDGRIFYNNTGEGILLVVDEITGKVKSIIYLPTDSQQQLRCPDSVGRLPVRHTLASKVKTIIGSGQYRER